MEQQKSKLLERIQRAIDADGGRLTPVIQDCMTLARIQEKEEWETYFQLQLAGVTVGEDLSGRPPSWRKDPEKFSWQPAVTYYTDRKTGGDTLNAHSLELLEHLRKEASRDLSRLDASMQRTMSAMSAEIEHILARLRVRVRSFLAEVTSDPIAQEGLPLSLGRRIFIGHGRSPLWLQLASFLEKDLHLDFDEFNRTSAAGFSISERLGQMLSEASFAFIVATAEDERVDGSTVPRLNVVHEAGLFQGRLGFNKAIVLVEEGCELFSNIEGLGQIRFPAGRIEAALHDVRKVLEREGVIHASVPTSDT
jgi:predicted nucleotide-binding protein